MLLLKRAGSPRTGRVGGVVMLAVMALVTLMQMQVTQAAEPLPAPQGPVILTVGGNVGVTNSDDGAAFDRDMLKQLGVVTLVTSTPWTDGVPEFTGVLARSVLERVAAQGTIVEAIALNDYKVSIPIEDFLNYDVLLALEMNGEEMQVSDKGPVWIVYPRDDQPTLQDRRLHERWVWQLKTLHVQ